MDVFCEGVHHVIRNNMKRGKAAGADNLHPFVIVMVLMDDLLHRLYTLIFNLLLCNIMCCRVECLYSGSCSHSWFCLYFCFLYSAHCCE